MKSAPLPTNETARIEALKRYAILDTLCEEHYQDIVTLASTICRTQIALISLVDTDRQWFKAKVGLEASETPRELAFCAHAILGDDIFEVPNALDDDRFHDNPLVAGAPNIRFYAGAPLLTSDGFNLGTLCVIDRQPQQLTEGQRQSLRVLSKQTVQLLELKRQMKHVDMLNRQKNMFMRIMSHDIKNPFGIVKNYCKRLRKKNASISPELLDNSLERMSNITDQCDQILNGVLEWSQALEAENTHHCHEANLYDAVQMAASLYQSHMEEKQIQFFSDVEEKTFVFAHQTSLNSIVQNCLYNAIKFSYPESEIELKVQHSSDKTLIECIDHGRGVSPSRMSDLFDCGQKTASTPGTQNEQGSGMGTLLIYEMVTAAGGTVCAKETPGGGLTVKIELFRPLPMPKTASNG